MKINLSNFEALEKIREEVRKSLSLPAGLTIDFALDSLHGVNELSRSLADLHPHKRSIATLGAQPPPVGDVAKAFAKQGYTVQEIPCDLTMDPDKAKAALIASLETLKKDTLFVLTSDVEPITGLVYPWDLIRAELAKKSIFLLWFQSQASLQRGLQVPASPLEACICDPYFDKMGLNLVLKGERVVGERLLWGEHQINAESVGLMCEDIKKLQQKNPEKTVKGFEEKLQSKFKNTVKLLPKNAGRLKDRGVFFIKGVNGDSLVHELKKSKIETASADSCFWENPHLNNWLPKLGFSEEDSQTCTVISAQNMENSQTFSILVAAIEKLQKISGV